MNTKTLVGVIIAIVFVVGAGYLVYMGRPVMKLQDPISQTNTSTQPVATNMATGTPSTSPAPETVTSTPATTKPVITKPVPTPAPSKPTSTPVVTPTPTPTPTPEPAPAPNTFTLADVQAHSSPASCWTTIEGGVYDLTSWISRHPGGPGPIQGLCGTDGTARFESTHGNSRAPRAALVLLKIGTLR